MIDHSPQQQPLIEALALLAKISATLNTASYIWGGLTIDIYQGRILRNHDDIDVLTQNCYHILPAMAALFEQHQCSTRVLRNGDLGVSHPGINLHLGNITVQEKVVWTHNGHQAALHFPQTWLCAQPITFYGVPVYVVKPELEYVLKSWPHLLNPQWQPREKDVQARKWLRSHLEQQGIMPDHLYHAVFVEY